MVAMLESGYAKKLLAVTHVIINHLQTMGTEMKSTELTKSKNSCN